MTLLDDFDQWVCRYFAFHLLNELVVLSLSEHHETSTISVQEKSYTEVETIFHSINLLGD